MSLPQRFPRAGLPERVTVYEVGARDGLQNEKTVVSTEVKAEFIARLAEAGAREIEATSFVHPKWVPQLADAEALIALLPVRPGVRYPVLVPNPRGLERAIAAAVTDIAVFASATEIFAKRNLNSTVEGALSDIAAVTRQGLERGMRIRGYVSMCFGDPWEGAVAPEAVVAVVERLIALGCYQVSLGDTIGTATPGHVIALLDLLAQRGIGPDRLAVHFHDTYGQALSNTLTALQAGITTVDASAGGLGGCPYAESATGNLATEDLVWMLDGLGIETGMSLPGLVDTSLWMAGVLGRPTPSRAVQALTKGS
ncbi:MAG TPA: hydroxymethylglutaryl-CoA lyase [Actinocrinis sp.]